LGVGTAPSGRDMGERDGVDPYEIGRGLKALRIQILWIKNITLIFFNDKLLLSKINMTSKFD
jgi:hypothetical protein